MKLSVFAINLDERVDRWQNVLNEQSIHLINPIVRISAIEARNASMSLTKPAVAACWESHRKTLREFLKTKSDYALILEDDFTIESRDIHELLHESMNSTLDFIQIGFLNTTLKESIYIRMENLYDCIIRIYGYIERKVSSSSRSRKALVRERVGLSRKFVLCDVRPGAHAYLVNRVAAQYLSQVNYPTFLSTDDLYMALGPMRAIRMARLRISSVGQIKSKSSINPR
jgi:GR25 family glycosyltransferase involved in LPS biosynthesis